MIKRVSLVGLVCLTALLISSCSDSTTTSAVVEEAAMTSSECSSDRGCRDTSTTSPTTTTTTTTTTSTTTAKSCYGDYVRKYPDLLAAYNASGGGQNINGWGKIHYNKYGKNEGRSACSTTSTTTAKSCYGDYVRKYPDLLAAYNASGGGQNINGWGKIHYNKYGKNEGRSACSTTSTTTTASTTTAPTTTDTLSPGDYQYLCKHNECSQWGGRTMRWGSSSISVYSFYPRLYAGVQGSWPVNFYFTSSPTAQIKLNRFFGSHCGVAYPERWTDGTIRGCRVQINWMHRRMNCGSLQATVKHEIGHCIGFFEHTSDGGLMDATANRATAPNSTTRNMIRLLYSLPPGTNITSRLRSYSREGGMKYNPDRPRKLPTKAYY